MKNFLILSLTACGACFLCFASIIDRESSEHLLRVVNIFDITESELNRCVQGECSELAVEFSEGSILPLDMFLGGNFITFAAEEELHGLQIEVKQTFYIRCMEDDFIFSLNLEEWKPFFEFATGSISVALGTREGGPFVRLGADAGTR
jgi:hypothetical protein